MSSLNTFIDCKVTIEIGVGAGSRQSAAPTDCWITHNAFLPGKWALFRIHSQPANFSWEGNKHQVGRFHENQPVEFERLDLHFERALDGLLRPTNTDKIRTQAISGVKEDSDGHARGTAPLAGCDDPSTPRRRLPSAANTGPTWR